MFSVQYVTTSRFLGGVTWKRCRESVRCQRAREREPAAVLRSDANRTDDSTSCYWVSSIKVFTVAEEDQQSLTNVFRSATESLTHTHTYTNRINQHLKSTQKRSPADLESQLRLCYSWKIKCGNIRWRLEPNPVVIRYTFKIWLQFWMEFESPTAP